MANSSGGLVFLALHPFVRATVADKLKGAIVGAALGDCIGLYTEFLSKKLSREAYPSGRFQLVDPATPFKVDGHRNKFLTKSWTDDTDHALLIVLSYLHHNGQLIPDDLAARLRTWAEQGLRCLDRLPLGSGLTVGRVVFDKGYLNDPPLAAYKYWVSSGYYAAPNGSLMRTHPLGVICVDRSLDETFRAATEFSLVTHADPRCIVACCISTGMIRGVLRGEVLTDKDIDAVIEMAFEWVCLWQKRGREYEEDLLSGTDDEWVDASMRKEAGDETEEETPWKAAERYQDQPFEKEPPLDRDELYKHVRAGYFCELELDDAMKMGYVYKALGTAVLALRRAMHACSVLHMASEKAKMGFSRNVFEDIVTTIIMEGGDADTNACIAGALLGAWLGHTALPPHWRDGIEHHDWLLDKCEALSFTVGITDKLEGYRGSEDSDAREDGGRGFLSKQALEAREMAFMATYWMKRAALDVVPMKKKGWREKMFST